MIVVRDPGQGVSSYTANDEGCVNMLIDYDTPLNLEGEKCIEYKFKRKSQQHYHL